MIRKLIRMFTWMTALILSFNTTAGEAGFYNPIASTQVQFEQLHSTGSPSAIDGYVHIFANNVYHLSQQRGSRLMPFVQVEGMVRNAKQLQRMEAMGNPVPYTAKR